jgi:hypothetical protein
MRHLEYASKLAATRALNELSPTAPAKSRKRRVAGATGAAESLLRAPRMPSVLLRRRHQHEHNRHHDQQQKHRRQFTHGGPRAKEKYRHPQKQRPL